MADLSALVAGPGGHSHDYTDPVFPGRHLRLHSACPPDCGADTPLLFVLHGVARNGRDYRDYWADHAAQTGILAIAVEFSEAMFPEYLWYHFGNLHDAAGGANPREQWTFGIIPRLFDALRAQGVTRRESYGLFGHSAGGQFVHRMLSFGYRERVAVAVSANAGTYAMPDLAIPWPFGLGETMVDAAALGDLLRFPIIVMAGTNDTRTTGKHFPGGPRSMRQGPTRWHRAHEYLRLGREAAAVLGTDCAWRVIDVPGVGHSGRRMSEAAAPVIAAALHRGAP
jgi:poly(3-hydroxybutyrate) depolymerase